MSLLKEQLEIINPVYHQRVTSGGTFKFYESTMLGVGPQRRVFASLEEYVSDGAIDRVCAEFQNALPKLPKKNLTPVGLIPQTLLGFKCLDEVLLGLSEKNYSGLNLTGTEGLNDIKGIIHEKYKVPKGWDHVVHLRDYGPYRQRGEATNWLAHTRQKLPMLVNLVESLPFKTLGYCMIICVNPKLGTTLHRDSYVKNNDVHLMNIVLNKPSMPFYVLDQKANNVKNYCRFRSFIFNELDLHGSDPEDEPTYILRIDGQFEDEICRHLGFHKNFVWHENYYNNDDEKLIKIHDK